jgi:hypothetical protein
MCDGAGVVVTAMCMDDAGVSDLASSRVVLCAALCYVKCGMCVVLCHCSQ